MDIESSSIPEPNTGCWLWLGYVTEGGYGRLRGRYAHRISYETARGPIPDGLHVDHLCRVRSCVNPDHLEAVTPRENHRRSIPFRWPGQKKQVCDYGHYSSRRYIRPDGRACCMECRRLSRLRYEQKRRAA